MNKSLAERIGEHTREVIAKREDEKRAKNRADVLSALTEEIKSKASEGRSLFSNEERKELDFEPLLAFDKMPNEAVEIALKDIGFEIHRYPILSVAAIPQENVSSEIQELLKMYYEILNDFENMEKAKAKADCKAVLKKLEEGEYEIIGINRVTVDFSSNSSSEQYKTCVRETMKAESFDIDISTGWNISIIQEDGD